MTTTTKRATLGVCLCVALVASGCGDDDRPTTGTDSGMTAGDAGGVPTDAGASAMDAGPGTTDAGGSVGDSGDRFYADGGCLTPTAANEICGFASDDRICALSVMCGTSTDDGQCKINCEMGATVRCYGPDDVSCLESATTCAALAACGWIL